MLVMHFPNEGTSASSWMLCGSRYCAVVDPARNPAPCIEAAGRAGLRISTVLETHLHADFVSGHTALAAAGARIAAPRASKCAFEHDPVSGGDTLTIEDMRISVVDTPGHTPDHVSYVVTDLSRGTDPVCVFCGDTLFVGDVGRPDLFPGKASRLAGMLHSSLHERLLSLPDHCAVMPAHGEGSLCGRSIGRMPWSTVGYERLWNPALRIAGREDFVRFVTTAMPPVPDHFTRCSRINASGPVPVGELPDPPALSPEAFRERMDAGAAVVDARSYEAYGGLHIPGSFSIDLDGSFSTFSGWILPPDRDLLLVAENPARAARAVAGLRDVGMDRVAGFLEGSMPAWARAGYDAESVIQLAPGRLTAIVDGGEDWNIVDVRSREDFEGCHLEGSVNIPAHELRTRFSELVPTRPTLVMCGSGRRSSMAASILQMNKFRTVFNLAGGFAAAVRCSPELGKRLGGAVTRPG